jgi:hypothetical protein
MAAAYVQSAAGVASGAGTSIAKAYTGANTIGSLLVAVSYFNSTSQACTFSDNVNSWYNVGTGGIGVGGLSAYTVQVGYAVNTSSSTLTVTASYGGSNTDRGLAVVEASGVTYLDPASWKYLNYKGGDQARSAVSLSPSADSRYWLTVALASGSTALDVMGGGFTIREWVNFANNYVGDKIVAGLADQQATFGLNTNANEDVITFIGAWQTAPAYSVPTRGNFPGWYLGRLT